jgi:hypothetical protein
VAHGTDPRLQPAIELERLNLPALALCTLLSGSTLIGLVGLLFV